MAYRSPTRSPLADMAEKQAFMRGHGLLAVGGADARLMNLQLRKEAIDKETERCLKEAPDANSR